MKFDTIIIGGGLSGLTCGIALAQQKQRVAIINAGQSTLHFNSGSLELLGYDENGELVDAPLKAIPLLSNMHPFHKLNAIDCLAKEAKLLLNAAGLVMKGSAEVNHYRLSPIGINKPAWLTMDGLVQSTAPETLPWKRVTIANIAGFLDMPVAFLSANLQRMGVAVDVQTFTTKALEEARKSPSEMRATNIAKVLTDETGLEEVAQALNALSIQGEVLLLPSVLGLGDDAVRVHLQQHVRHALHYVATMPPSVPGVHIQTKLRQYFQQLGGLYVLSDTVCAGVFEDNRLVAVQTEKMVEEKLYADHFVLASGSFQSRGLKSNYNEVYEPIFHADVNAVQDRSAWTAAYVYDEQPYMKFGVHTDSQFLVSREGRVQTNLYAAGSILSGHNAFKLADGTGVSMLTALQVAHNILKK